MHYEISIIGLSILLSILVISIFVILGCASGKQRLKQEDKQEKAA